jgi:hypothetical protein
MPTLLLSILGCAALSVACNVRASAVQKIALVLQLFFKVILLWEKEWRSVCHHLLLYYIMLFLLTFSQKCVQSKSWIMCMMLIFMLHVWIIQTWWLMFSWNSVNSKENLGWVSLFPFLISFNTFWINCMLMVCILTNSQHVTIQFLDRWGIYFIFIQCLKAIKHCKSKVNCKYHLHRDKKDSWRATTSRTMYHCDIHCRWIVGSLL